MNIYSPIYLNAITYYFATKKPKTIYLVNVHLILPYPYKSNHSSLLRSLFDSNSFLILKFHYLFLSCLELCDFIYLFRLKND